MELGSMEFYKYPSSEKKKGGSYAKNKREEKKEAGNEEGQEPLAGAAPSATP